MAEVEALSDEDRDGRDGGERTVQAAQRGDLGAFEVLYREHVGRVHALCLRMSGDAVHARTLTQDAFVRCWERLSTFQGRSSFGAWLYRLATNVVLEDMRRHKRRVDRVALVGDLGGSVEAAVRDRVEDRLDLETAVAQLPHGARMAFVLHDVEGYSHDEIAVMTGRAPGTIRAQLHRARQLLMKALNR
jgi:RNA polymerase sigma-70 factor, ECF subfamily